MEGCIPFLRIKNEKALLPKFPMPGIGKSEQKSYIMGYSGPFFPLSSKSFYPPKYPNTQIHYPQIADTVKQCFKKNLSQDNKSFYHHLLKKGGFFVLASVVGCDLLGIVFHCYKGGSKRSSSFHPFNPSVWNRRIPSPASKRILFRKSERLSRWKFGLILSPSSAQDEA